jgi:hypothetical protein
MRGDAERGDIERHLGRGAVDRLDESFPWLHLRRR